MRHLLSILLLSVLSMLYAGNLNAEPLPRQEGKANTATLIDSNRESITQLQDKLRECRFDTPQANSISMPCNRQHLQRLPFDSNRCAIALTSTSNHNKHQTRVRRAVATSLHRNGYYIYTLRHIII